MSHYSMSKNGNPFAPAPNGSSNDAYSGSGFYVAAAPTDGSTGADGGKTTESGGDNSSDSYSSQASLGNKRCQEPFQFLQEAQRRFAADGRNAFNFEMPNAIGEGFTQGGNELVTTSNVQAIFRNGQPFTLFPKLTPLQ
jgi:hypothetical protein